MSQQTPKELQAFYDAVRWSMPCCPNCEIFQSTTVVDMRQTPPVEVKQEYCGLDPLKRPIPAKTVAFGCPRFIMDVPF